MYYLCSHSFTTHQNNLIMTKEDEELKEELKRILSGEADGKEIYRSYVKSLAKFIIHSDSRYRDPAIDEQLDILYDHVFELQDSGVSDEEIRKVFFEGTDKIQAMRVM